MSDTWGYLPSSQANLVMANQDTERTGGSLNVKSPDNAYVLAALFILAFNYGVPTIFSGYDYNEYSDPAPQDASGHTNPAIQNMVGFHNAVGTSALKNIFSGSAQRIDGNYCDIIHANFESCASATYTVAAGKLTASVGAHDAAAFYVR
ncbi:hypothetical protein DXG01_007002 [Tephrocybe rancida]|nr:hypothetical protein DXG01_007002 [Tephrocybe rancida]